MRMRIPQLIAPLFVALISLTAACSDDDDVFIEGDASLLVINESDFAIVELYLTEVNNPDWGPNLLGGDVLLPGEDLLLGVACDFYDALLVDEDGVDCEIQGIDLCLNDADWVIRNDTCLVFEANDKSTQNVATTLVRAARD